jgi:gamma-glutamyltranspeptidase/glutathione hydrolase
MALESARFTKGTFDGCDVSMESRIAEAVRQELAQRGHIITPLGGFSGTMGNGEAVMRDAKRGVNFGASDPRTDGAAIPEQPVIK